MKRILSGVLVPLLLAPFDVGGVSEVPKSISLFACPIVVDRCKFVVSALGGGGNDASVGIDESVCERQRKDSPVPKKWDAGCGASVKYAPKT